MVVKLHVHQNQTGQGCSKPKAWKVRYLKISFFMAEGLLIYGLQECGEGGVPLLVFLNLSTKSLVKNILYKWK